MTSPRLVESLVLSLFSSTGRRGLLGGAELTAHVLVAGRRHSTLRVLGMGSHDRLLLALIVFNEQHRLEFVVVGWGRA